MKYVKLFENFNSEIPNDFKSIKSWPTLYRWITQIKLFDMCFHGDPNLSNVGMSYVKGMHDPNILNNPNKYLNFKKNFVIDNVWHDTHPEKSINFTVDHTMEGAYFNDSIIRIDMDTQAMIADLGESSFDMNFICNSEGEVRVRKQIVNWPKYLKTIHINKYVFDEADEWEEDEFIDAVSIWFPNELRSKLKIFDNVLTIVGPPPHGRINEILRQIDLKRNEK